MGPSDLAPVLRHRTANERPPELLVDMDLPPPRTLSTNAFPHAFADVEH